MGEAARTGGEAVGDEQRGPEDIRRDIDQTREELGDTVEALAAKTDVKARAKSKVDDAKERARAKADEARARAQSTAEEARARALAKVEAVRQRTGSSANGAPAGSPDAAPGENTAGQPYGVPAASQLRGAVASPTTYVVIGALAGLLLLRAIARR